MHVIIAMFLSVQILVRTSTGELQAYAGLVEADGVAFDVVPDKGWFLWDFAEDICRLRAHVYLISKSYAGDQLTPR